MGAFRDQTWRRLPSPDTFLPSPLPDFPSLSSAFFLRTPMPMCTHADTKDGCAQGVVWNYSFLSSPLYPGLLTSTCLPCMQMIASKKITGFHSGPRCCHQIKVANPPPFQEFWEFRQAKAGWHVMWPRARPVSLVLLEST